MLSRSLWRFIFFPTDGHLQADSIFIVIFYFAKKMDSKEKSI